MSRPLLLLAFGLAGCAAAPPAPSLADPSNPDAAESPLPRPTSLAPSLAAMPQEPPDAGPTRYVCPMHPEVVRDAPGVCPKCHMTLVPQAAP